MIARFPCGTGKHFSFPSPVFLYDLLTFRFTDFLHDDLLRRLCSDATEFDRLHWHLNVTAWLRRWVDIDGVDHSQFPVRNL